MTENVEAPSTSQLFRSNIELQKVLRVDFYFDQTDSVCKNFFYRI